MTEITKKSEEQKDAEAEVESFRKNLGPFVVAAESTRMAMMFTDAKEPDNPIIFARAFSGLMESTGFSPREICDSTFVSNRHGGFDGQAILSGLASACDRGS
jgi:hypothetical protein